MLAGTLAAALAIVSFALPDRGASSGAAANPEATQSMSKPQMAAQSSHSEAIETLAEHADDVGTLTLITPSGGASRQRALAAINAQAALSADDALATVTPRPPVQRTSVVRAGDSLSLIFKREGIAARDLHLLMTTDPLGKRLRNIFPGQQLAFTLTSGDTLARIEYSSGPLQTLVFVRDGDKFIGEEINREPERVTAYKHGVIENSLFLASQRAGLNDTMTMRLAQIFQWDIDFVLDLRRGDEFSVLFEELYVDGEFIGHGDILAAEFVNRGRNYRAIRYTDKAGTSNYYTPEGNSMRQAFLRAPVEFSRISSNFNMNRTHPLFNRSMPHRGIDYAAPTGTPILASGDGRVITASRTAPNGNYVVIQHGQQVTTKYLHLSKFGANIKQGVRVRQGQVIGYVGATGWASGPHLHYEFLVNGVHQNPRTVKLPQADPIPRSELAIFIERSAPLLALLDNHKQQQLAMAQ
jgi:murein DD-endopeptidase MepM/ murein hydrolase activator NlpD